MDGRFEPMGCGGALGKHYFLSHNFNAGPGPVFTDVYLVGNVKLTFATSSFPLRNHGFIHISQGTTYYYYYYYYYLGGLIALF